MDSCKCIETTTGLGNSFFFAQTWIICLWTNIPASGNYDPGDIAWVLVASTLVWIMIPGIGFFYSGLLRWVADLRLRTQSRGIYIRRKNALSMNFMSMTTIAVVSFQVDSHFVLFEPRRVRFLPVVVPLGLFSHLQ